MFNIGPLELVVLMIVGLVVLGPDRIPGLARDAARLIRTLREMATGARTQLRDELGPEFADIDLRSLNPRTALQRAILGDEDLSTLDPRNAFKGGFGLKDALNEEPTISMTKPAAQPVQPLARGEQAPFDADAT
ncbi:sec-independent translocase [Jatrophihabitans sp.]|uniref:sec-independent translocase n=1 Tax=Jatrophihabitans sp. TaxID=1932789 RepID=UPI0030C70A16|nr:preprotein translocase [Jatrophihabitans sp.]